MEALGNRVIILADKDINDAGEQVSDSGIIIRTESQVSEYRDQTTTGTIVDFGPAAWLDPIMGGEPWVEKGDRVVFAKYSGKFFTNPEDDVEYICVNDDAIQVKLEKEK